MGLSRFILKMPNLTRLQKLLKLKWPKKVFKLPQLDLPIRNHSLTSQCFQNNNKTDWKQKCFPIRHRRVTLPTLLISQSVALNCLANSSCCPFIANSCDFIPSNPSKEKPLKIHTKWASYAHAPMQTRTHRHTGLTLPVVGIRTIMETQKANDSSSPDTMAGVSSTHCRKARWNVR